MKLIVLLVFISLGLGLYFTLVGLLKLPTLKTGRAMTKLTKSEKTISRDFEAWILTIATKVAAIIRMNEYKRVRLEHTLKAAMINLTPEEYVARALVKAGVYAILMIPAFWIFPLANILIVVLMVMTYLREIGKADQIQEEKRESIEGELYRFASTITQELKNSRDVLSMLENYKKNAGPEFRQELDVLCADMRSSSYEAALTRFEARLNSPQLSDVVRGLIGVLRGDDGAMYFQMLTHDFKQAELRRLKDKAAKIPPKIRVFSFVMLMCYLATFFVIIFYEIIHSMSTMF